jgi:hypothetical protein
LTGEPPKAPLLVFENPGSSLFRKHGRNGDFNPGKKGECVKRYGFQVLPTRNLRKWDRQGQHHPTPTPLLRAISWSCPFHSTGAAPCRYVSLQDYNHTPLRLEAPDHTSCTRRYHPFSSLHSLPLPFSSSDQIRVLLPIRFSFVQQDILLRMLEPCWKRQWGESCILGW